MSLAAAFDARCAKLQAAVQRSSDSLSSLHREHVRRDVDNLQNIAADVTRLRTAIKSLDNELKPKLIRLADAEPQHATSALPTWAGGKPPTPFVRAAPSTAMHAAATKLQTAWRRRRSSSHAASALAAYQFCPASLRRNFVLGVRQPFSTAPPAPAAAAAPATAPPQQAAAPEAVMTASIPSGGGDRHFMSML